MKETQKRSACPGFCPTYDICKTICGTETSTFKMTVFSSFWLLKPWGTKNIAFSTVEVTGRERLGQLGLVNIGPNPQLPHTVLPPGRPA